MHLESEEVKASKYTDWSSIFTFNSKCCSCIKGDKFTFANKKDSYDMYILNLKSYDNNNFIII